MKREVAGMGGHNSVLLHLKKTKCFLSLLGYLGFRQRQPPWALVFLGSLN